jgi:hypothetical protein
VEDGAWVACGVEAPPQAVNAMLNKTITANNLDTNLEFILSPCEI